MKARAILIFICTFLLLSSGLSMGDELSDLRNKMEEVQKSNKELKQQVGDMEKKLTNQGEEVEKLQSQPSAHDVASELLNQKVNIGGHFKFFLADYADGERNDVDQHNNYSMGVSDLWLYVGKSLTDWMDFEVAPKVEVLASATPRLGSDIDRSSSASVDVDLDEAYVTVRPPNFYDIEARFGAIYPYFSEDYASRTWWHEQYHGNNGLLDIESWRAAGVELYRNFDFSSFSLPVYFYFLNGDDRSRSDDKRFTDNNGDKNLLIHVSPEFYALGGRTRLLGSAGWGKWDEEGDNDSWQYAAGLDFTHGSISILGEYLRKEWNDWPLTSGQTDNVDDEGWYVRAMYTFNPTWRVLVKYSDVDLFFPDEQVLTDNYKTVSFCVNYWIMSGSTIIPQVEYVDADRSDSAETLKYLRYTLGWRTTF